MILPLAPCARLRPLHPAPAAHRRRARMPKRYPSAADTDAMVERVAPAILELLADGVPRSRRMIVGALADRHPKDEVVRTLMRLAVTGQVIEIARKYGLVPDEGVGQDPS
jgi:hypothetical protein